MGTMGKCCCGDCCLTPELMPFTTVSLIAPTDDCEGGLGGGGDPGGGVGAGVGEGDPDPVTYPTASLIDSGCCYTAEFNLACQEYTEHCGLYASQDVDFAYKLDVYRAKASYLEEPGNHECPCIKVQSFDFTYDGAGKIYWVARYKLKSIMIHVGRINVVCAGSESPICKYYVAATYKFEYCDAILPIQEYVLDTVLTGHYKVDQCSTTETFQQTSSINSCQNLLDADPWGSCPVGEGYNITRIKLFDSLPTGQVSITDADYPPFSVGGSSGCVLQSQSCALNVIDNCIANLPAYNGLPPSTYWFCTPFDATVPPIPPLDTEGCSINAGCPTVETKTGMSGTCEGFVYSAQASCYQLNSTAAVDWPGIDLFYCGSCTIDGVTTKYYTELFSTFLIDPGFPDLCETGECCFEGFDAGLPVGIYNCKEFVTGSLTQEDLSVCRVDILDYTCSIGDLVTYTTGAFCFNLPTVTIQLS